MKTWSDAQPSSTMSHTHGITPKFKERYVTLGFKQEANLDEGPMWPIAFALMELIAAEEARVGALVKKAVS